MELRHLRYFAAVADLCHFGRAAEQLHIAQPALSQAIRQLETELGTPLLTRTTRQVRLTPAGAFFREEVQRILASVDASVRGVRRIAAGRQGLVRVAFTGTAAFSHLPRIARLVQEELPGVGLEIHADLLTPAQCDGLRHRTIDLGVLRPPVGGDGLTCRTIEVEPLLVAVARDHPLAQAPSVAVADLSEERFVMYAHRDSVVNQAVLRVCRAAGFVPHHEHEAVSTAVLLPLVAAGLGVALVPASARAMPLAGVVLREVAGAAAVELALAWREGEDAPRGGSPAVAAVLALLAAHDLVASTPQPELEVTR